jgi:putative cardiolipin synthase
VLLASFLGGCASLDVQREPSQALPANDSAFGRSVQAQAAPHQGQSGFRLLSDSTEAFMRAPS